MQEARSKIIQESTGIMAIHISHFLCPSAVEFLFYLSGLYSRRLTLPHSTCLNLFSSPVPANKFEQHRGYSSIRAPFPPLPKDSGFLNAFAVSYPRARHKSNLSFPYKMNHLA